METQKIMDKNTDVMIEFFKGIASCDFYDGLSHQLYLDLDDNTMSIKTEASDNTWSQRDDDSLVCLEKVSGYCDIPEEDRFTEGCSLSDYGYSDWEDGLFDTIESRFCQ